MKERPLISTTPEASASKPEPKKRRKLTEANVEPTTTRARRKVAEQPQATEQYRLVFTPEQRQLLAKAYLHLLELAQKEQHI